MASSRRRTVTLFTSIPNIAEALAPYAPSVFHYLQVVQDDALSGYGGTVEFDPTKLSRTTRDTLRAAEILIAEPAVLAKLLLVEGGLHQHTTSTPCDFLLDNLEWCQSTYAGVDPLFSTLSSSPSSSLPSFRLTRFAGKFGPPIAEWCLARIIGHERSFAWTAMDQQNKQWAGSRQRVTKYRYLCDLTLTILGGSGDIGRCIGQAAKALGMRVVGHGKTTRDEDDVPNGLDVYTTDLSRALSEADYVVSVLPSTPDTRGMLGGDALAPAARHNGGKSPVFLNVGRGDVLSEASLLDALDQDYISAAILDVFVEEPLPKESPLWDHPNVVVSPHVSGITRAEDVPQLFLENYRRYVDGKELLYQVDWTKGY